MSRDQILVLDQQRLKIERELAELSGFLTGPGMPGLTGPLVDAQGFPLPGLDLYQVRASRQKFNSLNNDHKALMHSIEDQMAVYYGSPTSSQGVHKESTVTVSLSTPVAEALKPFALISEVTEDSPAALGGLQLQDQVLQFGPITYRTHDSLQALAKLVRDSESQRLAMNVLRRNAVNEEVPIALSLVPGKWEGHGLLGCRFQAL